VKGRVIHEAEACGIIGISTQPVHRALIIVVFVQVTIWLIAVPQDHPLLEKETTGQVT
jgi:hypothetical protein